MSAATKLMNQLGKGTIDDLKKNMTQLLSETKKTNKLLQEILNVLKTN